MKKTFKIYPPTKSGSQEMFSDFEKEVAFEKEVDLQIDDAIQAKHEKLENKMWEDSDENFEGEKNIGWGMKGEL